MGEYESGADFPRVPQQSDCCPDGDSGDALLLC